MPASVHHVIPSTIPSPQPGAGPATGPASITPRIGENTVNIVHQAGGQQGAPILLVVLALAVALLSYWALRTASSYASPPPARPARRPRPWSMPADAYEYSGPRRLLREAFLKARAVAEIVLGRSLKALTVREIAGESRDPEASRLAGEYSLMMYSRYTPSEDEAERLARRLVEVVERWRGGERSSR